MTESKPTLPPEAMRPETGRRLKATRLALELTPRDIYDAIGINKKQWSNYETGFSRPNVEDAIRFSVRFGVSLQWLYLGDIASLSYELASKVKTRMKDLD